MECNCTDSKSSNNLVVLSLTDALTPVTWMFDIKETGSFAIKVEQDANGIFALQKIDLKTKAVEDIAYYSNHKKAVRAMARLSSVVSAPLNKKSGCHSLFHGLKSISIVLVCLSILIMIGYILYPRAMDVVRGFNDRHNQTQEQHHQPNIESDTDAIGVPMSADDFLKSKGNNVFPF